MVNLQATGNDTRLTPRPVEAWVPRSAYIAIPRLSHFRRISLRFEHFRVIHVLIAVINAKGACTMTTSTIENRESAQATATETPGPAKKAKVAAPKPRVSPAKPKSANKTTAARKRSKAAHHAAAAPANVVRQGSKTAKVLELVKRSGGATLKHLMKATGWQAHSVRGFLSGTLGKKMGLKIESNKTNDGERVYSLGK
jgi:hypothetical protein